MAIAGQSLYAGGASAYAGVLGSSGLDAILKDLKESLYNMVEVDTPALKEFRTAELNWSGRRAVIPLRTGISGSFAGAAEGGALPEADKAAFDEAEVTQAYVYAQLAITGPSIAATRNNEGALARALQLEIESLTDSFSHNLQRMFWGFGSSGYLAKTDSAGLTVSINEAATDAPTNTAHLIDGMKVRWGNAAAVLGTPAGHGKITDVTADNEFKVSLGGGLAPANTDYFVMGDVNATSAGTEFNGMRNIASTTAICEGLDPALATWWKPRILQLNAGTANVVMIQEHLVRLMILYKKYNRGHLPDMLWGEDSMQLEVFQALYPDQRFQPLELKGGLRRMTFTYGDKTIPFYWDSMCFRNELMALERKYIKYAWNQKPTWLTQFSAGKVLRQVEGSDQGRATYGGYGQLVTFDRKKIVRMQDFTASIDFGG